MNPVRTCPVCMQTDDHPRHVTDLDGTHVIAVHMDCCALTRDCEICTAQLADVGGVHGNPKGDALRDHLVTTGPAKDQPGWTAPATEV